MKNVYLICGNKRSGHHAIINWLCNLTDEPTLHLNDCKHFEFEGSFFGSESNDFNFFHGSNPRIIERFHWQNFNDFTKYLHEAKNIVLNFENMSPWKMANEQILNLLEGYGIKDLNEPKKIIVLRDPYNWLASVIENSPTINTAHIRKMVEIWKEYADCFKKENSYDYCDIAVNFNCFIGDISTRQKFSNALGTPNRDIGLKIMHFYGSSFEKGIPDHEKLCNRYKKFENDPIFLSFIGGLKDLSGEIFDFKPF